MKAKITKGKSFRGVLNYVFGGGSKKKDDRAEWIGGSLGSIEPKGLLKEFTIVRNTRPEIKKTVWHCSLTLSENEHLSNDEWDAVAKDFMRTMKFDLSTPYVAVRHNDTDYDHIHIVASKIPVVGRLWDDGRDVFRAIAATQELEEKYNLTRTPGYKKRESARETYRERKKAERLGVTPPRIQLQELIDSVVADKPTASQFAQRLEDAGVIVRANLASTGKMNGFSFELDSLTFKGSQLGKAYGWSGLQKRGVSYDVERDAEGLERYRLPVEERPPRIEESDKSSPIYIDIEKPDQKAERERQRQIDAKLQKHPYMSLSEAEQWVEFDRIWSANSEKREAAQEQERQRIRERAEALWAKVEAEREEEKKRAQEKVTQSVGHSDEKPEIAVESEPEQPGQEQSESIPEVTQAPTEASALSEALRRESDQQQQWVKDLCYDLADLLNSEQTHEVKGKHRTVAWDQKQQRLTLRENETQEVILDAKWKEGRWQDNGSSLTTAFFEQIKQALDRYNLERERELQKQKSSGRFELE